MSGAPTKALTLCTTCNTAFSGAVCPTCGKTVDNIYAESETKEKFMNLVNAHFNADFSMPQDMYVIPIKCAPTKELAFVRGLVGEQNKIHALSFRIDTGVRIGTASGYKGCFGYFVADKDEQFEHSADDKSCIENFDTQTSSQTLCVNLFDCVSLAELEQMRGSICAEELLCALCFALIQIFVELASKNYNFPISSDDELFVELKGNRVISVKYIALANPMKYTGDLAVAQAKNISQFCNYIEALFQRFCDVDQLPVQSPNNSIADSFFAFKKTPLAKFEYSWTLYKLLMLANVGKKQPNGQQSVADLQQFKQLARQCAGIDFEGKDDKHFGGRAFNNTVEFAGCSVRQLSSQNSDGFCTFASQSSDILVAALVHGGDKTVQTAAFTADLAHFCYEYLQSKLYGGASLTAKNKAETPFYLKLKGKLKKNSLAYLEQGFVSELVQQLCNKADQLNEQAEQPLQAGLCLAFVFRYDNSLHAVNACVGNSKIFAICGDSVQSCNSASSQFLGKDCKPTIQSYSLKTGDSLLISTSAYISNLKNDELCAIVGENSAKCSLYNILATGLLQGSTEGATHFVLKPTK